MSTKNHHIKEYLDYYCSLKSPPEFAVMLKGSWGSGKTWFIQQYIETLRKQGFDCLYTSLYGVSSFDEIEDDFFRQMHPLLCDNGLHLTGKIVQHVLKESIEIENDAASLPPYLQNSDRHILFIDDLERCKLPINEILGYLNDFVEHKGLKVIIALNEEEISDKESYHRLKEKLVGQTFEITSDTNSALERFIANLHAPDLKKILQLNSDTIATLYHKAGYNNLRHLKQAVMDFERFHHFLPKKAQQLPELLVTLMKEHLAFAFEIRKGSLAVTDIMNLSNAHNRQLFSDFEDKNYKTHSETFIEKYADVDVTSPIIGLNNMKEFFETGIIDPQKLSASIENSRFFVHENQKEWLKLWHYFDLNDEEFHQIFSRVQQNYMEKKYTKTDELLHIYGLFLELSFNNLYDIDAASIVQEAKEHIQQLKNENRLHAGVGETREENYTHLQYHSSDTPEFNEIATFLGQIQKEALVEQMPQITHNLLILMRTDSSKFWNMIAEQSSDGYHDQIIFPYIDTKTFVKHFIKAQDMRKITAAIKQRYKSEFMNTVLLQELSWLQEVRELLVLESHRKQGELSGYVLLKCIKEGFDVAISRLERAAVHDF